MESKLDKEKDNKKKPLKLSSSGRMQIRKNLGPSGDKSKSAGNKKTIQIVFRNKNNQQKSSSTAQSTYRGSSSFRSSPNQSNRSAPGQINSNFSPVNKNKIFENKNKKSSEAKKQQPKKSTLKPIDDDFNKLDAKKILEQEEQEYDKFPSLAKIKRAREKEKLQSQNKDDEIKITREVQIPEVITVQDLSNRMAEKTADVVKTLMKLGVLANATQSLDADTAELVVAELGHNGIRVNDDDILKEIEDYDDKEISLEKRAPVVTIMGHVDHGKTSILDAFRSSNVVAGESGGITQHIGAYQIGKQDNKITFIDTPGHAAFSNMRARGASTTDIIILVVAADDSLKPQTIESISHAKAAKVPIIVAINKIDLPSADIEKVRNDLLSQEIIVEKLSGDVLDVEVSALKKINLDKLQEAILLQADILNLKANPNRSARGSIIESKLEKGRGPVATVLVQKGTLKVSDIFVSGSEWGKVKALIDDKGNNLKEAPPSSPVEVLGFDSNPLAGDDFIVVESESVARKIAEYRFNKLQIKKNKVVKSNVEEMFEKINQGKISSLPIIIKADVQGSSEAIENSVLKLSTNEVEVTVIHKGVGAITESDVALANSGKGFIIGFNVRALPHARDVAKRDGVDIKYYSIIYELIDDVTNLLSGLLKPDITEKINGNVEIREVFSISKIGNIAGCMVKDGTIKRNSKIRLLRDNIVIHTGNLTSLKRFKEEVKEVKSGFECGVMLENYSDIKIGDIIETFEEVKKERKL
ncbi:translation initiation factor IF-2 [Pelagibacterales bacterium SAG-MED31]|nr:translation initiation factor IF-2 [Pelagibacterales bacterium SAG-MED31]